MNQHNEVLILNEEIFIRKKSLKCSLGNKGRMEIKN